jgi:hypothetical protein
MALPQQLELELDAGIRSLATFKPAASAREPVLWVERLEVHGDFPAGESTRLRKMELRKGLNILWLTSSDNQWSRLGGHGAGKTTFCRLLRYAIGDAKPGSRQFRKSFPNGWFLTDVWNDCKRWRVKMTEKPTSPA